MDKVAVEIKTARSDRAGESVAGAEAKGPWKALQPVRTGGGLHLERQGAQALRVRHESPHRYHDRRRLGRRDAIAAGQPL